MRRLKHRVLLMMLPVVLAAGTASAYSLFTCRDGVARTECCCPKSKAAPIEGAGLRANCCDVQFHQVEPEPSASPKSVQLAPPPAFPTARVVQSAPSARSQSFLAPPVALVDTGPPILFRTQSFLI